MSNILHSSRTHASLTAWQKARFGLMIHWGLYSILGGYWKGRSMDYIGEWVMSRFRIPNRDYEALAKDFNPTGFDADQWCRLAKQAGMRYLIFTTKHHDGFAMFRSKVDPYNIVDATPFGRDPVAELAVACKAHGLQLGLYYSQSLDWHEFDAGGFDPGLGTNHESMSWCNDWDFPDHSKKDFNRYLHRKAIPQIEELLTNYGDISHLWFDCPFTITTEQSSELYALAKSIQPGILINSRLGNGLGDFNSLGDNMIPGMKLAGGWEALSTINDTWGYKRDDQNWKKSTDIVGVLSGLSGKGINYLLNIGPNGDGFLPEPSVRVLEEIGHWMVHHSVSIHEAGPSPFASDFSWGSVTSNGNKLFLHILSWPSNGKIMLDGLLSVVSDVRLLHDPSIVLVWEQIRRNERCLGTSITLPAALHSIKPTVIVVTIDGKLEINAEIVQQADGRVCLAAPLAQIHVGLRAENQYAEVLPAAARFEPDGSKVVKSDGLKIATLGCTMNWWSAKDWLSWSFEILAAGDYEVKIVSARLAHDGPWQGGHVVKIEVGAQEFSAMLNQDEPMHSIASRHYAHAVSNVGRLFLEEGRHELLLKAVEVAPSDDGLTVVSVNLDLSK